jgi:hypothetical protein
MAQFGLEGRDSGHIWAGLGQKDKSVARLARHWCMTLEPALALGEQCSDGPSVLKVLSVTNFRVVLYGTVSMPWRWMDGRC